MGKYAYVKIEYYIISQANEFVNRFYDFLIFLKIFSEIVCQMVKVQKKSRYPSVIYTLR